MNNLTDEQRLYLTQQEYKMYQVTDAVPLPKLSTPYGYVSEVIDNLSGLQAYIITDIKLPAQPTKTDLSKVSEITILYRGSSASFGSLEETIDTMMDWIMNNVELGWRIALHGTGTVEILDGIGTIQLEDAANLLNESLVKYPNAKVNLYGHSLGSMNGQFAVSNTTDINRIQGAYFFNGPNIHSILNDKQKKKAQKIKHKIFNYVDMNDIVGLGYVDSTFGGLDKLKNFAIGQVIEINSQRVPLNHDDSTIDRLAQHSFGGYLVDKNGNFIHKDGTLVDPDNRIIKIDINGDNKIDVDYSQLDFNPTNLFYSSSKIVSTHEMIKVNPVLLRTLS